ncbi:hypothetical protein EDD17DRAFT_1506453 [Pisolithus thermaeus]|nr:hypothetical protein EV401DRAFT_1887620 [Pisolithus croceorrhizus]KAI6164444.1 hypothetical protein EDD17DRAFT_1506453 [Pisolithus thermaeus]
MRRLWRFLEVLYDSRYELSGVTRRHMSKSVTGRCDTKTLDGPTRLSITSTGGKQGFRESKKDVPSQSSAFSLDPPTEYRVSCSTVLGKRTPTRASVEQLSARNGSLLFGLRSRRSGRFVGTM